LGTGQLGKADGQFNRPVSIYVDDKHEGGNSNILVTDYDNHQIQIFDCNGKFIRKFGTKGDGPGQLKYPWDLYEFKT